MTDVAVLPPLATSDYRTLFNHYIDPTVPHPRPHDAFVVTVDGLLMAHENAERISYSAPPNDPDTLMLAFGVPRSFINAPGTPAICRGASTPPSLHYGTMGGIGNLLFTFYFNINCTR